MMKVVTTQTMRDFDRTTIQNGTASEVLMYRAACGIKDAMCRHLDLSDKEILILCGSGNNGGDGYALALLLSPICKGVSILPVTGPAKSKDAKYFEAQCLQYGVAIKREADELSCDVAVDAVFGAGFDGVLPEKVAEVFRKISKISCYTVAVDIPSGIDSDGGYVDPFSLKADLTVTFHCRKRGHVLPYTAARCGIIEIADIGLDDYKTAEDWHYIDDTDVKEKLPTRDDCGHKGTFGTLVSIVGCKRYQGAATLSAMASLRGGCGILEVIVPEIIAPIVSAKINSGIVVGASCSKDGLFDKSALQILKNELEERKPTAVLFGSGIGKGEANEEILLHLLASDIPLIIDGDGLGYLVSHLEKLKQRKAPTILTPHVGEFSRLCNRSVETVIEDFQCLGSDFAKENNIILVLKSDTVMIAGKRGEVSFLRNPNSGLAKGGSGDVLAGLIASFAAQGICAEDSALLGVYFHSLAAKLAATECGKYAMLPDDVLKNIPRAILPFEKN